MTADNAGKVGGLLLAAGGSSRMGRPKQLIQFEGKTLIRRATETLVHSTCDPIVVVLGAEIDGATNEIADLPANICINENWQAGMSSSIKTGLKKLLNIEPELTAVVITLCDQPHVTADDIGLLLTEFHKTCSPIVAAKYEGIAGVPALFSKGRFESLQNLKGDRGARDLIRSQNDITTVGLDGAIYDIDTPEDLPDR